MKKTVVVLLFLLGAGAGVVPDAGAAESYLTVGSISDDPKGKTALFKPFVDYIAARLKDRGIAGGKVVVVDTMEKMIRRLKNGRVDMFIDSPFPSLFVCEGSGARPLLRRWKENVEKYHSILLVRKESPIKTIGDLKGKTIAFKEPYSTSSYFLPKSTLVGMGYTLEEKRDYREKVSPDVIGYVFSHDDLNTALWIRKKRVAGGAINGKNLLKTAGKHENKYRILMKSIDVPRHIVSCRAGLPEDLMVEIERILLQMDKGEEGKSILRDFSRTTKFDSPREGIDRHLEPLRQLMRNVQEEFYGK